MSWLIPPKTHPLLLLSPFSLLFSVIYITHSNPPLLYFQSLSPSVTTPRPHVTLSPHPLSLLSSSSVTIPCSFVTLSSHTLSPLSSSSVSIPRSFVTLSSSYPVPPSLSCKECLPVLSTGAFTLSKKRPLKHAEHAFLASWRGPSCPLNMPFLEIRVQVFDSKEVTIVKETDMMSLSKWFA